MYYTGTKLKCESYNEKVKLGRNYNETSTVKWADIVEHKDGGNFAILKHEDYESDMTLVNELPSDWVA